MYEIMSSKARILIVFVIIVIMMNRTSGRNSLHHKAMRTPPESLDVLLFDPNSPVVKAEFSIVLEARMSECYFHYVPKDAKMEFQFKIISPPTMMGRHAMSASITDPQGTKIFQVHHSQGEEMPEHIVKEPGFYEICLRNGIERWGDKKIRVMFSYTNEAKLEEKMKEVNETEELTQAIEITMNKLTLRTVRMQRTMFFLRVVQSGHEEFMESMKDFVKMSSLASCFLISSVAYLQAYTLKRWFRAPPKGVPRA